MNYITLKQTQEVLKMELLLTQNKVFGLGGHICPNRMRK